MLVVVFAGLPGTGKSTLARLLANHLPAVLFSKDDLRSFLFSSPSITLTSYHDDFCMSVIYSAVCLLARCSHHGSVVIDGRTFTLRRHVQQLFQQLSLPSLSLQVVECVCRPETALQRIRSQWLTHPAENRDEALYHELRRRSEPLELPRLIIDTDSPLEECFERLMKHLDRRYK